MSKNKPLELALNQLKQPDIVQNAEYRFIAQEFGMVISFAKLNSVLLKIGQPYRIIEARIMRSLAGRAKIAINLIEYDILPNSLVIVPPNSVIQAIYFTDDFDFQAIVPSISTSISVLKEIGMDAPFQLNIVINLTDKEWEMTGTYFSLFWETIQEPEFRKEVVQHLLAAFLYNIKHYIQKQNLNNPSLQLSRQQQLFRRFIALVNENSRTERTVSFYADKLCLTPRYLNTLIRQISQQTVMEWINQAITIEAQILLKHTDLLIYQIADELNFPNPSFFCKFFKRMTGITPQEYQKQ